MSSRAPIALFAFKRPEHTARALAALAANPEFRESPLFVFCDGARREEERGDVDRTREVVRSFDHPDKRIVEAEANRGLAASIIAGVTQLCERFGAVIVVEDDLLVAPTFLSYMNDALTHYRDDARVMQVSGHMFPVELDPGSNALLLPFTTTWGWATWSRAWTPDLRKPDEALRCLADYAWRTRFDVQGAYPYARMLLDQIKGKGQSWGIWWYFHVFQRQGLTLYPAATLVHNDGFDGSGTNCGTWRGGGDAAFGSESAFDWPSAPSNRASRKVRDHLLSSRGLPRLVKDRWKRRFPGLPRVV